MTNIKIILTLVGVLIGGLIWIVPSAQAAGSCNGSSGTISSDITVDTTCTGEISISSNKTINVSANATLTLEPGVVLKMGNNSSLKIEGTLNIAGTATSTVSITSSKSNPVPGDWKQIIFTNGNGDISYAKIDYGGHGQIPAIVVSGTSQVLFDNVIISNSKSDAFAHYSTATSTISNSSFSNNGSQSGDTGLLVADGTVNVSDSTFEGNRAALECGQLDSGIGSIDNRPVINLTNVSFYNIQDDKMAILYYTCNIVDSHVVWPSGEDFYVQHIGNINGDMTLPSFGLPVLMTPHSGAGQVDTTISGSLIVPAGTVLKIPAGKGIAVEGKLITNGTQDNPVVFTSSAVNPAAGNWTGLRFFNNAFLPEQSVLNYTVLEYGGHANTEQLLLGQNANVSAKRLKFENMGGSQCALIGANAQFSVTDSDLSTCNATYIFHAEDAENTVMAENNWWGSDTGPHHDTLNAEGLGVRIKGNIDFHPWLGQVPIDDDESDNEEGEVLGESTYVSIPPAPVYPPVSAKLIVSNNHIHKGEAITLTWETTNANFIKIHGLADPISEINGSVMVHPEEPTTYRLEARNERNDAWAEVSVHVEPYDRDPVIVIPGILGSWQKYKGTVGELTIDPVFRTYDDLLNTLVLNGYETDKTLFSFPYQWRQSNEISSMQLKNKIDYVLAVCGCTKVDIVARIAWAAW